MKKTKLPKFKQISEFLEKKFPEILLILILLLISILSIQKGKYILSNDNYSPELNPTLSVSRYLESPAWRGYRVLGFASESEQADVFRSFLYSIFDLFLPSWLISQMFYFISMTVGAVCIGSFVRIQLKRSRLKRYSNWGYLLGGVTYFTTLWSMWLFYQNMAPYVVNFGFLPLLMLSIYSYSRRNSIKNLLLLLISSVFLTASFVIATLFVVDFVFILAFTLFINLDSKFNIERKVKSILITIGVFFLTQLFWILPFIHYTFSVSSDIIDSYTNRSITSSVIDLETDYQTLGNSARFYNRTLFEKDGQTDLFPMSELFLTYDFYKVLGLFPAIFSLIGLLYGIFNKNWKLFFWAGVAFVSLFLIKVLNPPLGGLFSWFQENIPLFKQVFRWPFSKLGQIYLIGIVLLSTFGATYLIKFFASFVDKKFLKRLFILVSFVSLCILQLIYSEYMLRGDIFADRAQVNVPSRYFELRDFLSENDSSGRIYYAPPSNNNYFRDYEWGFWGSQFISYILPNPLMDISSAVGSKVGERALIDIANIVRAGKADEFLSNMHKYDVEYVLFDGSVNMQGYAFELNEEKVKNLFSGYEIIWSKEDLILYKVPSMTKDVAYLESLSGIKTDNVFVKEIPKYPKLSPLSMDLKNLRIEGGDIVGDFDYRGYSTYLSSNLSEDSIKSLPSRLVYTNGYLNIYPSYPHLGGDNSTKPFRQYSGNYEYFSLGNSVLSKEDVKRGSTIEEAFNPNIPLYGFSDRDFFSINMMPLLYKSKGSDCSGGDVVENTFVTPQEVSSGFVLKGSSDSPCIYTGIPIDSSKGGILRVKINWESDSGNLPGFCVYSNTKGKCLNKEKFLSSESPFGEIDFLLDTTIEKNEKVSLILYTANISGENISEVLFRNVNIKFAPSIDPLSVISSSDNWEPIDVFLEDQGTYTVHIPVVIGKEGYLYEGINSEYLVWQPNRSDSESEIFEVYADKGLYQRVKDDYINQTGNLFVTDPISKYLIYWRGENISNAPSSLCLIYYKEDKCWFTDMLYSDTTSTFLNVINGDSSNKLLNIIYSSNSHELVSENILKEFALMQVPQSWSSLEYKQSKQDKYIEFEMENIFDSPNSTYYKFKEENLPLDEKILLSIPQASSSGWVAIKRDGILLSVLNKDTRVSIDGWKQAWDISNQDFDSISVIYWPNLLSYFGYLVIAFTGGYLMLKLIQKRKDE